MISPTDPAQDASLLRSLKVARGPKGTGSQTEVVAGDFDFRGILKWDFDQCKLDKAGTAAARWGAPLPPTGRHFEAVRLNDARLKKTSIHEYNLYQHYMYCSEWGKHLSAFHWRFLGLPILGHEAPKVWCRLRQ